jgi:FTR1 family protein
VLTTAIIAFREFFEAFLILGIFLGVSRSLHLRKEKEIWLAAGVGVIFSFALATGAYILDSRVQNLITEKNADLIEGYLLIFSGLFMAYVVLSLHKSLASQKKKMMDVANAKLAQNIFDFSLFLAIVLMVTREGVEIALFTAGTSLFSAFSQNMLGLFFGFVFSALLGSVVYWAYIKIPLGKVIKATEYAIVLLGASLLQTGLTKLLLAGFGLNLSAVGPLHWSKLPGEDSLAGHFLQSLFGVDREFSLLRLIIMIAYVVSVYFLFMAKPKRKLAAESAK